MAILSRSAADSAAAGAAVDGPCTQDGFASSAMRSNGCRFCGSGLDHAALLLSSDGSALHSAGARLAAHAALAGPKERDWTRCGSCRPRACLRYDSAAHYSCSSTHAHRTGVASGKPGASRDGARVTRIARETAGNCALQSAPRLGPGMGVE